MKKSFTIFTVQTMIKKMTIKELEEYIKLAKKHKLKTMHIGEIAFELRSPMPRGPRGVTQGEIKMEGQMPSDEDMLFYSSESAITAKQ